MIERFRFVMPLGIRFYLMAGVAVFAVTFFAVRDMLSWPYHEWPSTSALLHQKLDLAGPLVAFVGAYFSGRLTPPTRLFAQPRFRRGRAQFLMLNLGPLAIVVSAAYIMGLTPVLVAATSTATYGSLGVAVALTGLLALNAYLVLGWLLGLVARSAFVAPVAFALAFATTLAGYSGDDYAAVAPVLHISPTLGFHEADRLVMFRLAFLFVLLIVALIAADGILGHRGLNRTAPAPQRAALWLVPIAFVAFGVTTPPKLFNPDTTLPSVCVDNSDVAICVHEGHRKQLAALVDTVRPIIAIVGAEHLPFDRIYDRALMKPGDHSEYAHTFFYDLSPTLPVDSSLSEIILIASGGNVCQQRFGLNGDNDEAKNMWMLANRLGQRSARDNRFYQLTDSELAAWIAQHAQQVKSCSIGSDMLP